MTGKAKDRAAGGWELYEARTARSPPARCPHVHLHVCSVFFLRERGHTTLLQKGSIAEWLAHRLQPATRPSHQFKSQPSRNPGAWASDFTLVSRGFLTCKMGTVVPMSVEFGEGMWVQRLPWDHSDLAATTLLKQVALTAPAVQKVPTWDKRALSSGSGPAVSVLALPPRDLGKSPLPWAFWKLASHH